MVITKQLLEQTYYEILNERPWLSEIDYQKEWLTNPESYTHQNNVLAQAPAAGKSNTITIYLEIRFRLGLLVNPALLFSAAETLLKLNMADTFKSFNPSFKYIVVNKPDDIIEGKIKGVNVYISLPHMFTEKNKDTNSKLLPKIDLLITDEAHIWFQKKTIQNFIRELGIKQFVELTGSPYIFNLKNQIAKEKGRKLPYRMFYVTTNDLLNSNRISNVKIELITTPAYNFTHKSFVAKTGSLKNNLTDSKKRNRYLLESVLEGMLSKCNYNTDISFVKNKSNLGAISKLWHNIGNMFSDMGQTILACDSIEMAKEFHKILLNNSVTKDMILMSHSDNDPKSENFAKFEQNPKKYKLLIVVDRGQLGYNYLELFNIVDFTFSTNIVMIHQRLNRVTRKSKLNPDKPKVFFKVATNELEGYYKVIMSAVLHLNEKFWYENFNTKNLGQLPLTLIRKRKGNKPPTGKSTNKKSKKIKFQSFQDLELLDIELFKGVLHNPDGAYETYGITTLDEVKNIIFDIRNTPITKEKLIDIAKNANSIKELGYVTINEFRKRCISSGNWYGYDGQKLFEEITKHIPRQFIWSEDEIIKDFIANPPKSKSEYSHTIQGKKAKELGIFDDLTIDLPLGRIIWTDKMLEDACLAVNNYNDMISTEYGKKAYGKLKVHKNKKFIKKCLSHWIGFNNGKRFEWVKGTEPIFWAKVKETNSKTKQDLRENNLRNPAQKLGLWDEFPNRKSNKLGNNQFIKK